MFTIAGLVQLGSIKTTHVDLRPLVRVMAPAPNPQSAEYPQQLFLIVSAE